MTSDAFVRLLFDEIRRTHPAKTIFEVVDDVESMIQRLRAASAAAPVAAGVDAKVLGQFGSPWGSADR